TGAAAWLWARRAAEDGKRYGGDFCGSAPRENHRGADCVAHRESRLGELGKNPAGGRGKGRLRLAKTCGAAAGACGFGGIAEVRLPRCAVYSGAGVGAGNGGTSG